MPYMGLCGLLPVSFSERAGITKPLVLARVAAVVLRIMPRSNAPRGCIARPNVRSTPIVCGRIARRQAELRVARGVEERLLAADLADDDVRARDVRAAALVDSEERDLARAERRAVVDDAGGLRLHFAREDRRDARQEHRAHAADQAAARKSRRVVGRAWPLRRHSSSMRCSRRRRRSSSRALSRACLPSVFLRAIVIRCS